MIKDLLRYLWKFIDNKRGEAGDPPAGDPPAGDPPAGDEPPAGDPPEWVGFLPEEAAKDPAVTKYKTPDEFYKGYKNVQEIAGKKGVIVPDENASPEDREKFFNSIGRPESADEYKFNEVKDLHQAIENPEEISKGLAATFHEAGLTNAQADSLNNQFLSLLNESAKQQEAKQQEAMQATEAELRKEWGDKFDANKAMVGKVAKTMLSEEEIASLGGAEGIGNNPVFNKLVYSLASQLSEDTLKNIQPTSQTKTGTTAEEAKAAISAMETNKDSEDYKALYNERDPRHSEVVQKRLDLYKQAYGEGAAA